MPFGPGILGRGGAKDIVKKKQPMIYYSSSDSAEFAKKRRGSNPSTQNT
jgi:hypothetical protein